SDSPTSCPWQSIFLSKNRSPPCPPPQLQLLQPLPPPSPKKGYRPRPLHPVVGREGPGQVDLRFQRATEAACSSQIRQSSQGQGSQRSSVVRSEIGRHPRTEFGVAYSIGRVLRTMHRMLS